MPVKPYRLSPLAADDLEDIWLYTLRQWSLAQADSYLRTLVAAFEELAAGQKQSVFCTRSRTRSATFSPVFVCQDNRKPRNGSPFRVSPWRKLTETHSSRRISFPHPTGSPPESHLSACPLACIGGSIQKAQNRRPSELVTTVPPAPVQKIPGCSPKPN